MPTAPLAVSLCAVLGDRQVDSAADQATPRIVLANQNPQSISWTDALGQKKKQRITTARLLTAGMGKQAHFRARCTPHPTRVSTKVIIYLRYFSRPRAHRGGEINRVEFLIPTAIIVNNRAVRTLFDRIWSFGLSFLVSSLLARLHYF